jgi:hypothetical protein
VGDLGGPVSVPAESGAVELADDPGVTVLFLVGIDLVAAAQAEGAEGQIGPLRAELISGNSGEKAVQSVVAVDVADVLADNDVSSRSQLDGLSVLAMAINCSHGSSAVFHQEIVGVSFHPAVVVSLRRVC